MNYVSLVGPLRDANSTLRVWISSQFCVERYVKQQRMHSRHSVTHVCFSDHISDRIGSLKLLLVNYKNHRHANINYVPLVEPLRDVNPSLCVWISSQFCVERYLKQRRMLSRHSVTHV